MNSKNELRVIKAANIGNMVSINDFINTVKDAMARCNKDSLVYYTYEGILEMLLTLDELYENEIKEDSIYQDDDVMLKLIKLDDYLRN